MTLTKYLWNSRGIEINPTTLDHLLVEDELKALLNLHSLVLVRNCNITEDLAKRVGVALGQIFSLNSERPVSYLEDGGNNLSSTSDLPWHQDLSFLTLPPRWVILACLEVGSYSTVTTWAHHGVSNQWLADNGSWLGKSIFVTHSFAELDSKGDWTEKQFINQQEKLKSFKRLKAKHPLLNRNLSGERFLFYNSLYCTCDPALSAELNHVLYSSNDFYDHHWRAGDLVIFDNYQTSHKRHASQDNQRKLIRCHVQDRSLLLNGFTNG